MNKCFACIASSSVKEVHFEECMQKVQLYDSEVWAKLGGEEGVKLFSQALLGHMEENMPWSWVAAKLYCTLLSVNGSSAYNLNSPDLLKSLFQVMRRALTTSEGEIKPKKRIRVVENESDWSLFFQTLIHHSTALDENEVSEVFIHMGSLLMTPLALEWMLHHVTEEMVSFLLFALLKEALDSWTASINKERLKWIFSATRVLAQKNSSNQSLLAFVQRFTLDCEASTQVHRRQVIDFLLLFCGESLDLKLKIESFVCTQLATHAKASKRVLACDFLLGFQSSLTLNTLITRTCDVVVGVRCAALRSLAHLVLHSDEIHSEHILRAALEACTFDAKPAVRKVALKVLAAMTRVQHSTQVLNVCVERCRDESVSCRKTALETLALLIGRFPAHSSHAFQFGLLPRCSIEEEEDNEIRQVAQVQARRLLCRTSPQFVIDWLCALPIHSSDLVKVVLTSGVDHDLESLQLSMCQVAIDSFSTHVEFDHKALWSSWLVLECTCTMILPSEKILASSFIHTVWQQFCGSQDQAPAELQRRICAVWIATSERLTIEEQSEVGNDFLVLLSTLTAPPIVVRELLRGLLLLSQLDTENGDELIASWSSALKENCEAYLSFHKRERHKVNGALFLLGELATLIPCLTWDEPCLNLVAAYCSPDFIEDDNNSHRAFALSGLGKICLLQFSLAKRFTVLFVQHLVESKDEVLMCNSLYVLGDLGRKFTTMIEPFVDGPLAQCLGSAFDQVRLVCLEVFSLLLKEEFVKLRASLLYKILVCVADPVPEVASLAKEVLRLVHTKHSLFHFCGGSQLVWQLHSHDFLTQRQAQVLLANPPSRQVVYQTVLNALNDTQRMETLNKIRREILASVLERPVEMLMEPHASVVVDLFSLLEQQEQEKFKSRCVEDNDEEEEDVNNEDVDSQLHTFHQRATLKILDALERTNLVENVIPLLVSVHQVCVTHRSPLVKNVLEHFLYLQRKFPSECETALAPCRDLKAMLLTLKKPALSKSKAAVPKRKSLHLVQSQTPPPALKKKNCHVLQS